MNSITLIDYIVVYELVYIKHKDHSITFYQEVVKYMADWEVFEERLCGMSLFN
ncbi:MAG: M48 family metallopeptidase [Desulfocapsa sp.]|nr:M48 family metallopeptidase [Desulfocapsa sp.]MBU3945142.1 M48 family metallopeptidase [Pseudomonadota bacterium]